MCEKNFIQDLKIFHVVYWYPNKENSTEALWIQRHITSLENFIETQFILHLQVKPSDKFKLIRNNDARLMQRILLIPVQSWFLIEILTALLLGYYLIKLKAAKKFDIINFHIAYPLLTYWHLIKRFIKVPVIITEHWSAYHFHFNVREPKKLQRIKRIFRQGLPVITVSEALKTDIRNFAGNSVFPQIVIPNSVSREFVYGHPSIPEKNTFFMVSGWKWPKRPDIVIEAFAAFLKESKKKYFLRIGGYGSLLPEMEKQVAALGLTDKVSFLGKLNSADIADEMRAAIAFLHCSEYETFSVVCAEALSTGCPVVASGVGGIIELVDSDSGILVEDNEVNSWKDALHHISILSLYRERIATRAEVKYTSGSVGEKYYRTLLKLSSEAKR